MAEDRIYNFNPGPAALPLAVLEKARDAFLDFDGAGMSIAEISHRSPAFERVLGDAIARTRRLLKLSDDYHVLFLQGGASLQFAMIPMNFLKPGDRADYVNTGTWSTKAIAEARLQGVDVRVAASSEDDNFSYIPTTIAFDPKAVYAHITSNNTIKGTQWAQFPDTGGVPLIADMSSDIFSRPFDPSPFGMFYAGAQKNIGPAGVCMVVIRQDLLNRAADQLPTMFQYKTFASKNSLYNTPPCVAIYMVGLVLQWLEDTIGGIDKIAARNQAQAKQVYDLIDGTDFYRATARPDSRSQMNITFRLPTPELEQRFIAEAAAQKLGGLKGHRSVGGCRASIYNATPQAAVDALVGFMAHFAQKNG